MERRSMLGSSKAAPLVAGPISCHAWNADRSQLALCPNNNEIHIYSCPSKDPSSWKQEFVLAEHDQVISSLDWAPRSNRIVSCSHDRNAYVWEFESGSNEWKPNLVQCRLNLAALCVKWSPNEDKFAVSSGAKCVSVCYYEEENNWWVSKIIKKHNSSVMTIDWHPNNYLLATSSTDGHVRVFSAFIRGTDRKDAADKRFGGGAVKFGEKFFDTNMGGWVKGLSWSPDGSALAAVSYTSTVLFVDFNSDPPSQTSLRTDALPFTSCLWLNEKAVLCSGHELNPTVYGRSASGAWGKVTTLDCTEKAQSGGNVSTTRAAFQKFQSRASHGQSDGGSADQKLSTKHQNYITSMVPYGRDGNSLSAVSTCGRDGNVFIWEVSSSDLASKMQALTI